MSYYTRHYKKFKEFLEAIKTNPRPPTASTKWMDKIGFSGSNYYMFLQVLEKIGFVDSSRTPKERWKEYQDKATSGKAMAEGIKEGYDLLWSISEPYNQSAEDIIRIFQVELNWERDEARRAYSTFNILCEFADFSTLSETSTKKPSIQPDTKTETIEKTAASLSPEIIDALLKPKRDLGVNINIQVTLPETTEAEVYDKIFEALKRHFFSE
ncbi:DUF5343 domain-containing protein [archaeon]|nr:DUF5343 domain-containing protein [archaeon]